MIVSKIMTRKVHTIGQAATLKEVQEIFKAVKYHHLPVLEGTLLVGIVSDRDIYRLSSPYMGTEHEDERDTEWLYTPVSSFMAQPVICIDAETLIDSAAIMLLEYNISCLPIVRDDNSIAGIMTWKDLLKYYTYISQVSELPIAK